VWEGARETFAIPSYAQEFDSHTKKEIRCFFDSIRFDPYHIMESAGTRETTILELSGASQNVKSSQVLFVSRASTRLATPRFFRQSSTPNEWHNNASMQLCLTRARAGGFGGCFCPSDLLE
jgi:hypothetical protein